MVGVINYRAHECYFYEWRHEVCYHIVSFFSSLHLLRRVPQLETSPGFVVTNYYLNTGFWFLLINKDSVNLKLGDNMKKQREIKHWIEHLKHYLSQNKFLVLKFILITNIVMTFITLNHSCSCGLHSSAMLKVCFRAYF